MSTPKRLSRPSPSRPQWTLMRKLRRRFVWGRRCHKYGVTFFALRPAAEARRALLVALAHGSTEEIARCVGNVFDNFIAGWLAGPRGDVSFYSPAKWSDRKERFGDGAVLVVTHEACDLAQALNSDPEAVAYLESQLSPLWLSSLTNWATAVYP